MKKRALKIIAGVTFFAAIATGISMNKIETSVNLTMESLVSVAKADGGETPWLIVCEGHTGQCVSYSYVKGVKTGEFY